MGGEKRLKLFSQATEEEVQKVKQILKTHDCDAASKGQDVKERLFEVIQKKSESSKEWEATSEACSKSVPKETDKTMDIYEIVRNFEERMDKNIPISVTRCSQSVDVQGNPGNMAQFGTLSAMAVPAQMPIQQDGKRKGIDIDNAAFVYSGGNLYAMDGEVSVKVGNFALEILEKRLMIQELVNASNDVIGEECQMVWGVKVLLPDKAFQGYVEDSRLFELSWIERISERRSVFSSIANAKKLFKKYLKDIILAEKYEEIKIFTSCGWKWLDNGTIYYLTADGAVGFGSQSMKADGTFKLYTKPAEKSQNLADFLKMRAIIPGKPQNAVFLQYYLMAALLTALFKKCGHQIEFCTALVGKTNTKKTSCGEIFTRVFNRTHSAVPEINFSATEVAIYEIMAHYADAIVMIDDLTPSEDDFDAHVKRRKLESIIRAYGDRVPRRRSVAFAANRSATEFTPISGCALITGETFSGGKSSRSRVVVLNFEEGDVDNSMLTYYQDNLHTLPNFVVDFLCYVTSRVEKVSGIIDFECKRVRENIGNYIRLPRYIDALGALNAIVSIFGGYIRESGVMNMDDVNKLMETDRQRLHQIIMENDAQVSQISPGITILEALKYAMDKQKICVKNLCDLEDDRAEDYLLRDGNFYLITSDRLWECAKRYTDYRKIYFPYKNGREIIEPLKTEDFLYIKREGSTKRASHKITVNGKVVNRRFLYLLKEKVDKTWAELENF